MKRFVARLTILSFLTGLAVPIVACGDKASSSKSKKDKDDDDDDKKKKKKKSDDEEESSDDDGSAKKKKKKKSDDEEESSDDGSSKKDTSPTTTDKPPPPPPPTPTQTSAPPPPAGESFAGIYRSTYGDVRMRHEGSLVVGTYPGGALACTPTGKVLDCSWKDQFGVGKAKMEKQATGDLKGTWGKGASATDGGMWLFNLLSAGDPGPSGDQGVVGSFNGDYISTYGTVHMTEGGGKVAGTYPGGKLDCTPTGAVLDCDWRDSSGTGKARLTRLANGDLKGTWGNGASTTNGGGWLFRKK